MVLLGNDQWSMTTFYDEFPLWPAYLHRCLFASFEGFYFHFIRNNKSLSAKLGWIFFLLRFLVEKKKKKNKNSKYNNFGNPPNWLVTEFELTLPYTCW